MMFLQFLNFFSIRNHCEMEVLKIVEKIEANFVQN